MKEGSKNISTGVVILNYKNFNDTINCIQSVYQHCVNESLFLVVVDNNSQNGSVIRISAFLTHLKKPHHIITNYEDEAKLDLKIVIVKVSENLGYAKGNNIGIQILLDQSVENILILNNDILLSSNIISPLVNFLKKNPEIGLISPLLLKNEAVIDYNCCRNNPTIKSLIFESFPFITLIGTKKIIEEKYKLKNKIDLLNQELIYCDIVSGACIMASKSTWRKLKGFDKNTFLYYEENILYEKLNEIHLKSAVLTTVNAIHLGAKSTSKVVSAALLRIELDSLMYYLKEFRKISRFNINLIWLFKKSKIFVILLKNRLQKL